MKRKYLNKFRFRKYVFSYMCCKCARMYRRTHTHTQTHKHTHAHTHARTHTHTQWTNGYKLFRLLPVTQQCCSLHTFIHNTNRTCQRRIITSHKSTHPHVAHRRVKYCTFCYITCRQDIIYQPISADK